MMYLAQVYSKMNVLGKNHELGYSWGHSIPMKIGIQASLYYLDEIKNLLHRCSIHFPFVKCL
jgi:hypothetical protein